MVFYTDFCWSKTLKGKKWHKFLDFSISEDWGGSCDKYYNNHDTFLKVTYGLTNTKIWKNHKHTKSMMPIQSIGNSTFFVIIRTPLQFPLRAVEIGLGILHFCYQIKKKEEPNKERTLTTKAFVNEIWNGKVAWLSLMKPTVKSPPPPQSHCLKITQNVAFEFLNFGIFHQFLSY